MWSLTDLSSVTSTAGQMLSMRHLLDLSRCTSLWSSVNLGVICARLLLLVGKDNDVEPHSRLSAHLVVAYHAMLCVPVEHRTSANAGMHCLLDRSRCTSFGLDAHVYCRKKGCQLQRCSAEIWSAQPLLEVRLQRLCDSTGYAIGMSHSKGTTADAVFWPRRAIDNWRSPTCSASLCERRRDVWVGCCGGHKCGTE